MTISRVSNLSKTVLVIAGSDPSGGAGIQADLKTLTSLGVYGMTAITALTEQNTRGVSGIFEIPLDFFWLIVSSVWSSFHYRKYGPSWQDTSTGFISSCGRVETGAFWTFSWGSWTSSWSCARAGKIPTNRGRWSDSGG